MNDDLFMNREIPTALLTVAVIVTFMVLAARKTDDIASIDPKCRHRLYSLEAAGLAGIVFSQSSVSRYSWAHKIGLWNPSLWKPTAYFGLNSGSWSVLQDVRRTKATHVLSRYAEKDSQNLSIYRVHR